MQRLTDGQPEEECTKKKGFDVFFLRVTKIEEGRGVSNEKHISEKKNMSTIGRGPVLSFLIERGCL